MYKKYGPLLAAAQLLIPCQGTARDPFGRLCRAQARNGAVVRRPQRRVFRRGAARGKSRDDADTVAAVTGQIAGTLWGRSAIPRDWLDQLAWREKLENTARRLITALGGRRMAGWPPQMFGLGPRLPPEVDVGTVPRE
jgi:hypothetical protein